MQDKLHDYPTRETDGWDAFSWPDRVKDLPFWTEAVEYNAAR